MTRLPFLAPLFDCCARARRWSHDTPSIDALGLSLLPEVKGLTRLEITSCMLLRDEHLAPFARMTLLEELRLRWGAGTGQGFAPLAGKLRALHTLELSRWDEFDGDCLRHFGMYCTRCSLAVACALRAAVADRAAAGFVHVCVLCSRVPAACAAPGLRAAQGRAPAAAGVAPAGGRHAQTPRRCGHGVTCRLWRVRASPFRSIPLPCV